MRFKDDSSHIRIPKSSCYTDEATGKVSILLPSERIKAFTYECLQIDTDQLIPDEHFPRHYMQITSVRNDDEYPIIRRTYNVDGTVSEQQICLVSGRMAAQLLDPKILPLITRLDGTPPELNYDEDQERS